MSLLVDLLEYEPVKLIFLIVSLSQAGGLWSYNILQKSNHEYHIILDTLYGTMIFIYDIYLTIIYT